MAENISPEEVWDDSSLVNSWNEALAEYKKYHSLAAQGKKVDRKTLKQELAQLGGIVSDEDEDGQLESGDDEVETDGDDAGSGDDEPGPGADEADEAETQVETEAQAEVTIADEDVNMEEPKVPGWTSNVPAIPQALINEVQDESLKSLMMSWYYAGYYTGLYEGQQKAYASMGQAEG